MGNTDSVDYEIPDYMVSSNLEADLWEEILNESKGEEYIETSEIEIKQHSIDFYTNCISGFKEQYLSSYETKDAMYDRTLANVMLMLSKEDYLNLLDRLDIPIKDVSRFLERYRDDDLQKMITLYYDPTDFLQDIPTDLLEDIHTSTSYWLGEREVLENSEDLFKILNESLKKKKFVFITNHLQDYNDETNFGFITDISVPTVIYNKTTLTEVSKAFEMLVKFLMRPYENIVLGTLNKGKDIMQTNANTYIGRWYIGVGKLPSAEDLQVKKVNLVKRRALGLLDNNFMNLWSTELGFGR
jgi:hypothetical protein